MSELHPILRILVESFDVSPEVWEPYREQLLERRMRPKELKDFVLKHKLTDESLYQQAVAQFYELEYCEQFEQSESFI